MDKITLAGDVGGDVDKFIVTQEDSNPVATSTRAHVAIDALADRAKPSVDKLTDVAHKATDSLSQAASEARDKLMEFNSDLADVREKLLERSKTYVAENPIKAMAIGVVVGLLLTRLLDGDDEE